MRKRQQMLGCMWVVTVVSVHLLCGHIRGDVLAGMPGIEWTVGPARVPMGSVGTLDLPAGYRFTGPDGAAKFEELNQNPADPSELGVVIPPLEQFAKDDSNWFMSFSYQDIGYVKDDERSVLDAQAILNTIRDSTNAGNAERQRRGWPSMQVLGWQQEPAYDGITHHLTWAVRSSSASNNEGVNYNSRILGRTGVISVMLVLRPNQLAATIPTCRMIEDQINFIQGQTYQEFRPGDKTAQYGLTALITGGATVAAFKLWKPLVAAGAAVIAVLAAIARKIKAVFTGRTSAPSLAGPAPTAATGVVLCPRCQQKNRLAGSSQGAVCGHCKMPLN